MGSAALIDDTYSSRWLRVTLTHAASAEAAEKHCDASSSGALIRSTPQCGMPFPESNVVCGNIDALETFHAEPFGTLLLAIPHPYALRRKIEERVQVKNNPQTWRFLRSVVVEAGSSFQSMSP